MSYTEMISSELPQARWPWGVLLEVQQVRGFSTLVHTDRARNLVELLDMSLRWGDREFLVDPQRRASYAQHHSAVGRASRLLISRGVAPGDRVLLLAANSMEWIIAFWAIQRAGAVVVLGNGWWSRAEVEHAVSLTQPVLAIVDRRRAPAVDGLVPEQLCEAFAPLLTDQNADDSEHGLPDLIGEEDDPAVVLFTSGTSGAAKGAILSHRSIIANQHNFLSLTHRLPSQIADDHPSVRVLLSAPLFHTGGVQAIMSSMLTGTTIVITTGRFDAGMVLELIEREHIDAWSGVPTAVQRVVDHPDISTRDLSSLRSLGMGGAPLPQVLIERAAKAFPGVRRGVTTNYGMTEAGGIVASAAGPEVLSRPGTSGRVLPAVEVRIAGAQGELGEILVRSAALMSGYWGTTESPFSDEGWLHTGDVGRLDEDGFLYVVDRLKDLVIRGGENIASTHVEATLLQHPAVESVAVFGLAHHDLGEEVAAVVSFRPGQIATVDELRTFSLLRLAHYEVPSKWWIREGSFPLTATDKVDKRRLRADWPQD